MAVREIKATLSLDGEKQFSRQIASARNGLKNLQTQLKAETSAFNSNTTQMEKNIVKGKNLQKQIEQQKVIVNALAKAAEDAAKQWGENSKQADAYRQKLHTAQAELNKMNNELDATGVKSTKVATALSQASAALGGFDGISDKAGKALITFGTVGAAAVGTITTAVVGAISSIYSLEAQTAAYADELLTTGLQSGLDTSTIQQWAWASRSTNMNVNDMIGAYERLNRSRSKLFESEQNQAIFGAMGISTDMSNMDMFWRIIESLSEGSAQYSATMAALGDVGGADAFLNSIFGKGYNSLLPLIANIDKFKSEASFADENGLVIDEETLSKFGDLNDTLSRISGYTENIKRGIAAWFLPDVQTLSTDVETLANAFNKLINGDEGAEQDVQTAITTLINDIVTVVTEAIPKITAAIDTLANSDNETVAAVGKALQAIVSAIQWVVEHGEEIKTGFEVLFGVFASAKVIGTIKSVADNLAGIASALGLIGRNGAAAQTVMNGLGNGVGSGASGAAGTAASGGLGAALVTAGKIIVPLAAGVGVLTQGIWDESLQANGLDEIDKNPIYQMQNEAATAAFENILDAIENGTLHTPSQDELNELFGIEPKIDLPEKLDEEPEVQLEPDTSGLINQLQDAFNSHAFQVYFQTNGGEIPGHATGLNYVPYDNYLAYLHKGESVLTASQASRWRGSGTGAGGGMSMKDMRSIMGMFADTLSGVSVQMNGQAVGAMVAPVVSEVIAQQIGGRF